MSFASAIIAENIANKICKCFFSILKSPFLFPATHPPPRCHAPLARPFTYDISPRPAPHFLYCYLVSSRARSLPSVHFAPVPFPRVHTAYDTVRLSVIHRLLGPDVFPYILFSDRKPLAGLLLWLSWTPQRSSRSPGGEGCHVHSET